MKIVVEIPDQYIDRVRSAFSVQDQPASDEQLAAACLDHLSGTLVRVEKAAVMADLDNHQMDLKSVSAADAAIPVPSVVVESLQAGPAVKG